MAVAPQKISGDPRRPGEVKKYKLAPKPSSADIFTVIASLMGVASILLKIKAAAWVALLCCLTSVANMKSGDLAGKHILTSIMFALFCLFTIYQHALLVPSQGLQPTETSIGGK
ncbi:g9733 [Coccomyxa elongata]